MTKTSARKSQRISASRPTMSTVDAHLRSRKPTSRSSGPTVPPVAVTKMQVCLALLGRKTGATLDELMAATGWQSHSVRGFLSGTVKKKLSLTLNSTKDEDGERRYRILRGREGT